jgi:hypothetical protein
MNKNNARYASFVLLNMLILGLCPKEAPSNSIELPFSNGPNAEEIALFEELSAWVDPEESETPLGQIIREYPSSFEVFRHYHAEEDRYELLRTVPYGENIRRAAERYGLDGLLLASMVEVESSFNPEAVSFRGAIGLMQLMPATAGSISTEQLHDPEWNVDRGARYLQQLLNRFGGDLELALAAYNAGPGNVRRYGGIPPFRETQHYVQKVLSLYIGHHQAVWQDSEAGELLARS